MESLQEQLEQARKVPQDYESQLLQAKEREASAVIVDVSAQV